MSLVSSDSEGEQNELRNLQEKLESTMKLVSNLSGQLSELKDQVREGLPVRAMYTHPHTPYTHTPRTTHTMHATHTHSNVMRGSALPSLHSSPRTPSAAPGVGLGCI